MAIVLTNGKDYVKRCTCAGEELHTTQNVDEAKVYFNVNTAQRKLMRAPEELKAFTSGIRKEQKDRGRKQLPSEEFTAKKSAFTSITNIMKDVRFAARQLHMRN